MTNGFDKVMQERAERLRRLLQESTQENPVTLSPNLYDKLPPEQRYRFRRG